VPHFGTDLPVNLAGAVFGPNVFPPQFVVSLAGVALTFDTFQQRTAAKGARPKDK